MEVSLENLAQCADEFVAALPQKRAERAHVVGLSGDLGAGKTTFTQAVARALRAKGSVTSPTFVFAQRYAIEHPAFASLVHIDAYRLNPGEARAVGLETFFADPHNLVLVEWPERIPGEFPKGAPVLTFTIVDEARRRIQHD